MNDDLISRQAAIEALCDICPALKINGRCMFGGSQDCEDVKCLMSLPPAEPAEIIRCKDCEWFGKAGCAIWIQDESDEPKEDDFCSFAERRTDD